MAPAPYAPAMDPLDRQPLLFLVGPTASGKSELALPLAEAIGAEVLALDSMTVYRGLDVGTAKPGAPERARVPHHLLDLAEPSERYDVQRYLRDARAALADIQARGRRGLFVGGTGFYLRALTHGLFEGPDPDPELRAALERRADEQGSEALHTELARRDPDAAARIHPNDRKRVVRALEVLEQTGRTLTDWQAQWRDAEGAERAGRARRILGLAPPRDLLDERIERRVERMLASGWIDEVARIRNASGFGPTARAALGVPEILAHLSGELPRTELVPRITTRTRRFARSQLTWLRRYPDIEWAPELAWSENDESRTESLLTWATARWSDLT